MAGIAPVQKFAPFGWWESVGGDWFNLTHLIECSISSLIMVETNSDNRRGCWLLAGRFSRLPSMCLCKNCHLQPGEYHHNTYRASQKIEHSDSLTRLAPSMLCKFFRHASFSSTYPWQMSIGPSVTLSDFHSISVSGLSQKVWRDLRPLRHLIKCFSKMRVNA